MSGSTDSGNCFPTYSSPRQSPEKLRSDAYVIKSETTRSTATPPAVDRVSQTGRGGSLWSKCRSLCILHGKMEREMDWWFVVASAVTTWAELEGKAFDLPVEMASNPQLWSWALATEFFPPCSDWARPEGQGEDLGHSGEAQSKDAAPSRQKEAAGAPPLDVLQAWLTRRRPRDTPRTPWSSHLAWERLGVKGFRRWP